jgi:D-alanyl-D-alanine carboxypeptidase (penicillin-binding protein 5/6)
VKSVRVMAAAACLFGMTAMPAAAQAPPATMLGAKHVAILDYETGALLDCRDCDVAMPPASMSKLMTMVIVSEALKAGQITLQTRYRVSERAWRLGAQSDGSHMFLELNSDVTVEDLIKGVIVVSANDACIVLAEGLLGSEEAFVARMNQRAAEFGLTSARFVNTTGLPADGHVISARDLGRLAAIIIRDHGDLYRLYAERSLTYNGKTQENRNPLLRGFAGADGVKTGHTDVSGYGMIGSAVQNGQRRIIVFNGTRSMAERAREAQRLMRAAFADYATVTLYKPGDIVGEADVWLGAREAVPLTVAAPATIITPHAMRPQLTAHIVYSGPLETPIAQGAAVAKLVVEGPGMKQEFPLVAAQAVDRANPFARVGFALSRLLGGGS